MEPSDESLMERVQRGDLKAFETLFDRHQPRLYAFLHRFTGCAFLAEDLTQDVFYKIWMQSRTFHCSSSFVTWSYAIAKNTAMDARKRLRRETRFSEMAVGRGAAGDECIPDPVRRDLDETVALRETVRSALLSLPENQRMAVVLREYEGRSAREIGAILGCSENNARILAHRGRRALREMLKVWIDAGGEPCEEK
ncbi:MAG: RNA polymerase sigma factor [Armatimonadetes bacterium]|nr:RNA polymerase sigma factor [Armatimonadota bacterium]